ncbi:hypothetical protein Tco_1570044 [Tanacetum coccineum]
MPSLPSPEPTVSCFDDLDFFNDFENEFPAIVYNDAPTSKSDLLTEPILSPQHINEFDLNDETSLSEYDEEEQNVLYFNDLFPFNIIYPNDLKSEKDNNDNEIDIIQSSRDMALPPCDQRHQYLSTRMLIKHKDAQGLIVFTSRAWRRMFDIRGPLVHELILEFFSMFRFGEAVTDLDTTRAILFQLGGGWTLARSTSLIYWLEERLRGMTVTAPTLPVIDMGELVRLQICEEIDDTWAWVALGPERQHDAVVGALEAAEDAHVVDEGGQAVLAPVQAPSPPPAAARTMPQRMARLEKDVHEIREKLSEQREVIGAMAKDFSRFTVWATSGIAQLLDYA